MIDSFPEQTRIANAIDARQISHGRCNFLNTQCSSGTKRTFPRFFAFSPPRIDEARLGIHWQSIRIPRRHGCKDRRTLYSGSVSSARWRSVPRENTRMLLYRARYYPRRNFAFPHTSLRITRTYARVRTWIHVQTNPKSKGMHEHR